ncbi:unnamed protein product [Durusdinium trenchii]|uniref:CSC1/OSCA1-like 7TM region domain-containing protein n=1 Tax=Durusdinium trenchii TaxID=1381693 RepID=A0ABP0QJQ3_9DINO
MFGVTFRAQPESQSVEVQLAQNLPFMIDRSLIADNVSYEGPLATLHGSKEYLEAMQQWQELLPERLEDFKVKEMEAWQLEPGLITARWRVAFVAPLPPSPKLLELPEDVPKVPGAAVRVETTLRAELTLDAEGKVLRHEEAIAAGFGVLDAVARYELLTARRREVDPVSWYWRVLKETSLEEMAFYTNNQATTEELEWRFNEMVARNFLYGAVLGVLFWITLKITIAARMANLLEERVKIWLKSSEVFIAKTVIALHSDECDLQVELIQTASVLESRQSVRHPRSAGRDVFEDASLPASAFDREVPGSFLRTLLAIEEVKPKLLRMASNKTVTGDVNASSTTSTVTISSVDSLPVLGAASAFSAIVILTALCLFGCLKDQYPAVYLKKANEPGSHGETPPEINGYCGWVSPCWRLTVGEIANHSNLDHGMLVQFCDAAVMCFLSTGLPALLILCPLCAFGGGGSASSLSMLSFANVAQGSWTTYAYPVFVWYTVIVTQAFLFRAQRAFVERRYQWLRTMTEPRANSVLLSNLPEDLCKEAALQTFLRQQIFGSANREVLKSLAFVKDTSQLERLVAQRNQFNEDMQKLVEGEVHERRKAVAKAEMNKVEAQVGKLQEIIEKSDEYNLNSAFVTFHDRHDAVIVLKLFAPGGNEDIIAELPPDTDDVIWNDLRPAQWQWAWDLIGYLLLALVFLIFLPLVAINASFTNVTIWEKNSAEFATFMDRHHVLEVLSDALVGPLILNFLIGVLCSILASILVNFFVLKARGVLQHLLQRWYYVYLVILVLFVTAVGKSLTDVVDDLFKTPKDIPLRLAEKFADSTLFYMDFVILSCCVYMLAMLRLMPLYRYRIHSCIYEESLAISKSEPEDQDYNGMGGRSARLSLIYVLVLVLGTLAPVITIFGAIFFAICRLVFTYLFVYAETLKPDLGGLFWHQQLKHAQQGTFLYIALMTVLLLQRAPNPAPGIICSTSALFMAFSYYTFLHRFRWEQLEFSEIPAKVSEGAPEVPRVYGHYKQPELPPPKQKENTRLQRAATTMRMRVNTCCDVEPERRETRHKTMPH